MLEQPASRPAADMPVGEAVVSQTAGIHLRALLASYRLPVFRVFVLEAGLCPACNGDGRVRGSACVTCRGRGRVDLDKQRRAAERARIVKAFGELIDSLDTEAPIVTFSQSKSTS